MANIKTKNRRGKLGQQQKHMNQILGLILGEKKNRKLTLTHKRRKEYQSSFVISVAWLSSNRDLEWIWSIYIMSIPAYSGLKIFIKDITGYTLRTLLYRQIKEGTREAIRSTIQLTRHFWVYVPTKRFFIQVHKTL
jgi:hypothetical protein